MITFLNLGALAMPGAALAHASEQGFVMLLPTGIYTGAGVGVVLATILLMAFLPARGMRRVFATMPIGSWSLRRVRDVTSTLSFLCLALLIWAGLSGPGDPLSNPLTLTIWTMFWIGLLSVQAVVGNVWSFIGPFVGPYRALLMMGFRPLLRLPVWLGYWPGLVVFFGFAYLLLADPAPADPRRLARFVGAYWLATMACLVIFGPRWLRRGEAFGMVFTLYGKCAILGRSAGRLCLGLPGWQIARMRALPIGLACFCVILLGTGSFDGLNETFWWLGQLGINPLEFPGRSAVVWQSVAGVFAANVLLLGIVTLTLALGMRLARTAMPLATAFGLFAPTLLPIAVAYHMAHYLPSFLVDGQYALVALSDPFMTGADLLGLGEFYVSTSFFNAQASVRVIYLTQAGLIVAGHVLAVVLAHAIAVKHLETARQAMISQLPLAGFMIAYTFFGLWLLSSPRF